MFKCICHCTRLIRTFPFSEGKDLKPGRPGLYSQTSARPYGVARDCLRNRKLTSLTIGCARQSIQASLMLCSRWHEKVNFVDSRLRSAEHSSELDALLSLARELRVFMRRGRPYGWVMDDYSKKLGEMFGGMEFYS